MTATPRGAVEYGGSEVDTQPHAYNVWICGRCELHTVDTDDGGHLCETCGQLYDHAGQPLADDDE